jgi:hypothetical protein
MSLLGWPLISFPSIHLGLTIFVGLRYNRDHQGLMLVDLIFAFSHYS